MLEDSLPPPWFHGKFARICEVKLQPSFFPTEPKDLLEKRLPSGNGTVRPYPTIRPLGETSSTQRCRLVWGYGTSSREGKAQDSQALESANSTFRPWLMGSPNSQEVWIFYFYTKKLRPPWGILHLFVDKIHLLHHGAWI